MVTSKQTELIPSPFPPFQRLNYSKFTDSPAFIYFIASLSVAGLYSIITTLLSGLALVKPGYFKQLVPHFVVIDVLLLGIVAAATGAAGRVAYIGFKRKFAEHQAEEWWKENKDRLMKKYGTTKNITSLEALRVMGHQRVLTTRKYTRSSSSILQE